MTSDSVLAASHASPSFLAALIPVLVLVVAFDVYCLVDLLRARSVRYLPKIVWAVIIVIVSSPLGGVIYLFAGRDREGRVQEQ
jgi:hypothetical protein